MSTKTKSSRDFGDDIARWQAVTQRDAAADGCFFYGVRSTGIYCRPHCPSRPARRENVTFFATTAEAEKAGYRACKRCRPGTEEGESDHHTLIAAACRHIESAEVAPSLETLAAKVGVNPFHFHRLFKKLTGVTPKQYATAHRTRQVAQRLKDGERVTAAIYAGGFNSASRFYETSGKVLGMTPTVYRDGGAAETIRYHVVTCSLGCLLVAATERGVCSIRFGNAEAALVNELRGLFPKADISVGDAEFAAIVATTVAHVEEPAERFPLPLDIRGTAFQQRVWQALQAIPPGSTASYQEIADAIGNPAAVRAVAGACAANPVAVAVPCHRVVKSDGTLSGYRWGVKRKAKLLQREGAT